MAIDVIMPKLGESITEGTIIEWSKKVGDSISQDETLLEISTDKVDSEIPSPSSGTLLEILFNVNDVVPVGEIIARIGDKNEKLSNIDSKKTKNVEIKNETEKDANNVSISKALEEKDNVDIAAKESYRGNKTFKGKHFYSPLVKSIAKREGLSEIELESINGSGANNRINKTDILNYLSKRNVSESINIQADNKSLDIDTENTLTDQVEAMGRMRKQIADHMVQSQKTSSHVYSTVEVDMTNIVNFRNNNKEAFFNTYETKLTYTPIIIESCIKSIQEFPLMNVSLEEDNIIHHKNINIGVAVALPNNNLIVPVIKFCEEKNLLGIARSTSDLAQRSRDDKLTPEEIFGSTFTVTNPGVFGSLHGMAIINQPNVGILSVGSINKRPAVKETKYGDVIVIRSMMYLTLGYDHRIIDGAYGTKFLKRIADILENFDSSEIKI